VIETPKASRGRGMEGGGREGRGLLLRVGGERGDQGEGTEGEGEGRREGLAPFLQL